MATQTSTTEERKPSGQANATSSQGEPGTQNGARKQPRGTENRPKGPTTRRGRKQDNGKRQSAEYQPAEQQAQQEPCTARGGRCAPWAPGKKQQNCGQGPRPRAETTEPTNERINWRMQDQGNTTAQGLQQRGSGQARKPMAQNGRNGDDEGRSSAAWRCQR